MLLKLEQILEDGLVLDEPVGVAFVASALESQGPANGFKARGGFQLRAELHKVSGGVLLHARFGADVTAPCKRCLADVPVSLPIDFTLNLVPEAMIREELEGGKTDDDHGAPRVGSFSLQDADEELFDGRTIDLDPILREQVLLALPMNVVCREECKGLCATCGKDLNEGPCSCQPRVDPRWTALRNIKLN
jgi:uncharacterized protein